MHFLEGGRVRDISAKPKGRDKTTGGGTKPQSAV